MELPKSLRQPFVILVLTAARAVLIVVVRLLKASLKTTAHQKDQSVGKRAATIDRRDRLL